MQNRLRSLKIVSGKWEFTINMFQRALSRVILITLLPNINILLCPSLLVAMFGMPEPITHMTVGSLHRDFPYWGQCHCRISPVVLWWLQEALQIKPSRNLSNKIYSSQILKAIHKGCMENERNRDKQTYCGPGALRILGLMLGSLGFLGSLFIG